ncbi:MAG: ABC transporter ATP-binding protein [Desulfobacteraceae bacterium]|nr:ABC transporter ATP-binding protein [Desulfobacteraceae bacterium]
MSKKIKQTYSYIYIFKWIYVRLQKFRQKQFWILFAGMVCVASFETLALGSVALFASSITDPETVLSSKYINIVKQASGSNFLDSAKGLIIVTGFLMLFLLVIKNSIKALTDYGITRFSVIIETYFGETLLNGFLKLPYQWHLNRNTADLVSAMHWRIFLGTNFFQPCLSILSDVLMISIMLTLIFIIQPMILLIVLAVLGVTAFLIYNIIKVLIDKNATIVKDYQLTISKELTMAVQGIKDVKISQKEDIFISKFIDNATPLSRVYAMQNLYSLSPTFILEIIGFGMLYLSICVMLIKLNITTAYITGTMALLAVTAWKVIPAVSKILSSATTIRKSIPFITNEIDYFTIIEADKNIASHKNVQSVEPLYFSERIRFNDVSFLYESSKRTVIQSLNFEIKKGETIGVIGTSGSGKSTLIDLLIGLLQPSQGEITIDNYTLTPKLLPQWLKMIGYVSQSPYIYDGTIAENVAFGMNPNSINKEKVRECCSMAAMDDFLYDLPDNIDSFIGERGVKLSGGQQQRIAIARALYNKPEIMVFDEATSSLDTKSEKLIQDTIYSFKGKQTLIIVAHRLSTIEDCDRIIWLEQGEIILQGETMEVLKKYKKK